MSHAHVGLVRNIKNVVVVYKKLKSDMKMTIKSEVRIINFFDLKKV